VAKTSDVSKTGSHEKQKCNLESTLFPLTTPYISEVINESKTYIYLEDIDRKVAYCNTQNRFIPIAHIGQLKLFLTELQFLTDNLNSRDDKVFVIYAGSAPSNKLPYLADMFPNIIWILVDPNIHYLKFGKNDQYSADHAKNILYFKIAAKYATDAANIGQDSKVAHELRHVYLYNSSGNEKILRSDYLQGDIPDNLAEIVSASQSRFFIIEDYYTDRISELLAPLAHDNTNKVYFISDIRTNVNEDAPSDLDILWNSAMMYNWLKILKPTKFMIKFRCPYIMDEKAKKRLRDEYENAEYSHDVLKNSDIDFLGNFENGIFRYIKPEKICLQAFADVTSTESRLIGSNVYDLVDFDVDDYNDKFFYYNRVPRPYGYHTEHEGDLSQEIGIDRCGDCALMCHIFNEYIKKYNTGQSAKTLISELLRSINRNLKSQNHGFYFDKFASVDDLREFLEHKCKKI
jgi:hypothetical protein